MRQTVKRIHQGGCYHLPYFNYNESRERFFDLSDTGIIPMEKKSKNGNILK